MSESKRLTDNIDEFRALCERAPEVLGVAPGLVEKDYFAMAVLRAVADSPIVFKGGTSLSRAYGIIQRFSEDIDIIVLVGDSSNNQRKKQLRQLAVQAADATGLSAERVGEGSGWLNSRFFYKPTYPTGTQISSGVLLESGTRGGPEPQEVQPVRPLLAEIADKIESGSSNEYADLASFDVPTLHPARTLAEKLANVHHRSTIYDLSACEQSARHIYDIAMILRHDPTLAALEVEHRIADLIVDVDERSEAAGWGFTSRPDGGFADSPAFQGTGPIADAFRQGYESMLEQLVFGDPLTYDMALETVRARRDLL